MKCLDLEILDTSSNPYPNQLDNVHISIRGTKNLFNIFFKVDDIEDSFGITVPSCEDVAWVKTNNGNDRYITYPALKRILMNHSNPLIETYLQWVDGLLFSTKVKSFYTQSFSSTEGSDDTISDIDDSIQSFGDNDYIITSMEHKIQHLEHALELKNKDIEIIQKEIELKNKEIELLRLQLAISTKSEWI